MRLRVMHLNPPINNQLHSDKLLVKVGHLHPDGETLTLLGQPVTQSTQKRDHNRPRVPTAT